MISIQVVLKLLKQVQENVYQLLMSVCISQQLPDIVFVEASQRLDEIFQGAAKELQ